MTPKLDRTRLLAVFLVAASAPVWAHEPNLQPNPGFEAPQQTWNAWGRHAEEIVRDEARPHSGEACIRIPGGHAALYAYVPLLRGHAYRVSGNYRCSPGTRRARVRLSLCAVGKGNGSAGTRQIVLPVTTDEDWHGFEQTVVPTRETVQSQVTLGAEGAAVWFDDLSIVEVPVPEWGDAAAGTWDGLTEVRTDAPLFEQLLSSNPGRYHVSMWSHALSRSALPKAERDTTSDSAWEREVRRTFEQMGESHLGALLLPWGVMGGDKPEHFWRTDEFLSDLHERHGLLFDAMAESSGVLSRAVKLGAEVLNEVEVNERGARPLVSPVDPEYVAACKEEIGSLADLVGDRPYVRAIMGRDEPLVPVFAGQRQAAGPFMRACDTEVREQYGFGRYGMPAPGDSEWLARPEEHPFCWIAFNRWMADRYADAAMEKCELVKRANPDWLYAPCDFWLMSGHTVFDFSRMTKYADLLEGDPYASSAERTRGRGIYNHGFGAKLLADLGRPRRDGDRKPVEIIVQTFDYAGYEMTPEDLLEWCSQALRCGATSLCYYASDAPRFNDEPRWEMMLQIAKAVSEMNAIEFPTGTKTAILYCSTAHAAEGPTSSADEVYTAYALLGERLGCWFDILSDRQLRRGLRDLSDYGIVYLPLATYVEPDLIDDLEAWIRGGGVLVCGDPEAFSWAPDGTNISDRREKLFGVETGDNVDQHAVMIGDRRARLFPRRADLGRQFTARSVRVLDEDSRVLATYADHSPAIVSRSVDQGKAIYFAANPFTPETLFYDEPWTDLLREFQKAVGEEMNLPIWRFRLPEQQKTEDGR